jgi:hypothetical protein
LKFKAQFVTQFRGDTLMDGSVKHRITWATTEVEVEERSSQDMSPVLQRRRGFFDETAYHDGSHYWANADIVASINRGYVGYLDHIHGREKPTRGLDNFCLECQRRTVWNGFGFNFFDRYPAGHAYSIWPQKLKTYRPGGDIEWDETQGIAERYARYIRENTACVDGTLFMRIERPCIIVAEYGWQNSQVFTPFGGHGDAVIDFSEAYASSLDQVARQELVRQTGWEWLIGPEEVDQLDQSGIDPYSRSVRAMFMDLFRTKSWLSNQEKITRSKAAKKLHVLHELWKARGTSYDERHLDEVVDILLTITEPGAERALLDAWIDRPIFS